MNSQRSCRACIRAAACMCVAAVTFGTAAVAAQEITNGSGAVVPVGRGDDPPRPDRRRRAPSGGEAPPTEVSWALAVHREEAPRDRFVEVARLYHNGTYRGYERTELSDRGALPLERERFDDDDELVYREMFRYRQDGTLRETLRVDAAGDTVLILYGMPEDSWDEYVQAPKYSLTHRFDERGRPEYTRREEQRVPVGRDRPRRAAERPQSPVIPMRRRLSRKRPTPCGKSGFSIVTIASRSDVSLKENDENSTATATAEIVHEEVQVDRRIVRTVERSFDDEGRVTEVIIREAGTVQREIWRRETDGAFEKERIVDGVRVALERTTADGDRTVTRYRHGEPVVREFYTDDSVYRRQIFADGEIVRVEEL